MWLAPAWILRHRDLGGAEGCGWSKLLPEHRFVKAFHKLSRGPIVDLPETRNHARRTGVHEPARQSDESFAANLFSERRLTCAQHDEIRRQFQVIQIVESQKSILRLTFFIDERQNDSRKLGMIVIDDAMRCEVDHAILAQLSARGEFPACCEVDGFEFSITSCQSRDRVSFLATETQPSQTIQSRFGSRS